MLVAGLCGPASAATTNGQLAAVADGRLLTFNADGSGLRAYPVADAGQITELAFAPGGNRLAFVKGGELSVLELAGGRVVTLTTDAANPGWSADDTTLAFRRGLLTYRVVAAGGTPRQDGALRTGTVDIAWMPDAKDFTPVVGGLLQLAGLDVPPAVTGVPAWAPDKHAIAYQGSRGLSVIAPPGQATLVLAGRAAPPRWSGDSGSLVYAAGGEVRTLALETGEVRTVLVGAERLGPVDWQPCVPGVTLSCESVAPPRCSTLTTSATTQADQPIDLPGPPCTDPAGRPLALVVAKAPDHGTVSGLRYTPAPGYSGLDTVGYRVNNGVLDSEIVRVTVFVVPRGTTNTIPATRPPVLVQGAPFLSASATPRLDRRRRTLVKVACDQDCSLAVRLTGTLRRRPRKAFIGPRVTRSVAAKHVLRLRLRLPSKPRGKLKTVWVTGKVRNAAGETRRVKLPVRLPR
jgi:hypothetical protein